MVLNYNYSGVTTQCSIEIPVEVRVTVELTQAFYLRSLKAFYELKCPRRDLPGAEFSPEILIGRTKLQEKNPWIT